MLVKHALVMIAGSLALAFAPVANAATNIVTNGGFETGNASGWTVTGNNYTWQVNGAGPKTGNFSAYMGCVGASCLNAAAPADTLSQMLTTVAGTRYTLTFDYDPGSGTPNGLSVLWGTTNIFSANNTVSTGALKSFTVSNVLATSNLMKLTFLGRQDPAYLRLDNVSVVQSPIPESTTWAMMLAGFGMIGFAMRRRADTVVRLKVA